jgi:hypothetical protein
MDFLLCGFFGYRISRLYGSYPNQWEFWNLIYFTCAGCVYFWSFSWVFVWIEYIIYRLDYLLLGFVLLGLKEPVGLIWWVAVGYEIGWFVKLGFVVLWVVSFGWNPWSVRLKSAFSCGLWLWLGIIQWGLV